MLRWLNKNNSSKAKATEIYGAVVAQARQPAFFGSGGVPDTMVGRYESIVLHMFLVMERLRGQIPVPDDVLRLLVEGFVTDIDDCMREIGVGDLKVGGHVRRAAAGLYERIAVYRAALETNTDVPVGALEDSFAAHGLIPDVGANEARAAMADYVSATQTALVRQNDDEVLQGAINFPAAPALSA